MHMTNPRLVMQIVYYFASADSETDDAETSPSVTFTLCSTAGNILQNWSIYNNKDIFARQNVHDCIIISNG